MGKWSQELESGDVVVGEKVDALCGCVWMTTIDHGVVSQSGITRQSKIVFPQSFTAIVQKYEFMSYDKKAEGIVAKCDVAGQKPDRTFILST